jgi:hypothetical protein
MKKYYLSFLAAVLLISANAFSQSSVMDKASFAVLGGINFQNLNGEDSQGDKLENKLITGYHAGVNVLIPVAPEFYFQPGLLLSRKGAKSESGTSESKFGLSYIELPLNLVYRSLLGNGYFMLGFGPYLAYGVGGRATLEDNQGITESDIKFKSKIDSSDPLGVVYFRPFDAGGNIFFGYEFPQGIFAQFNAQLGMINIRPEDSRFADDDSTLKNTGFGLSVGYRF